MNIKQMSQLSTVEHVSLLDCVPNQGKEGTWLGRVWLPAGYVKNDVAGPYVVTLKDGNVFHLSKHYTTISDVVYDEDPVATIKNATGGWICSLEELLQNSHFSTVPEDITQSKVPVLLAPNDIQALKACGVTFAASLIERVIEERALGDVTKAEELRCMVNDAIGGSLKNLVPGSPEAMELKQKLIAQGLWSQYLEVGIGPDVEVFTKGQPMSAIACGSQLGVLASSEWNNPEPEIAFLVSPHGKFLGATLANDVNLRDYEGRSALLLGKAKDQNGSSPIGPFFRLFDETFSIEEAAQLDVELSIVGTDGFELHGKNKMSEISRSLDSIIKQVCNDSHQYPDGLTIMFGTMFAPTDDRGEEGMGFTHHIGDRVEISSPKLGRLINWVNHCDKIPKWRYGTRDLMQHAVNMAKATG